MIAIITYDTPHRKTQDLVAKLILNGYRELHLVVLPWMERKNFQPIFRHRPAKVSDIDIESLCYRFGMTFSRVGPGGMNDLLSGKSFDHVLIAGAGLLPQEVTGTHRIINAHPGYLPNVRGLDALKWSIYHGQPLGVTTHYISDKADEGQLIERRIIPVYFEDTFHSVAWRVYETEIEMLVSSISQVENKLATYEPLDDRRYVANKRMPHSYEMIMMSRFEEMRRNSNSDRSTGEDVTRSGDHSKTRRYSF
jgi:phosphoribosylglycinamide formyltransferase-1